MSLAHAIGLLSEAAPLARFLWGVAAFAAGIQSSPGHGSSVSGIDGVANALISHVADALDRIGEAEAYKPRLGVAALLSAGLSGAKRVRRSDPYVRASLSKKSKLSSTAGNLSFQCSTMTSLGQTNADVDMTEMLSLHNKLCMLLLR